VRLGDAYGRIEELVAPVAATLSSARWRGVVEAVLDPSVVTLDLCGLLELHPTGPARERVTPTAPTAELEAGGGLIAGREEGRRDKRDGEGGGQPGREGRVRSRRRPFPRRWWRAGDGASEIGTGKAISSTWSWARAAGWGLGRIREGETDPGETG
jgi:hypothetical protein